MLPPALSAICVFRMIGFLHLEQSNPTYPVKVHGNLTNLSPGKHGMHVHTLGNTLNNCTLAGDHFNPWSYDHGGPDINTRHAGDFGNIEADESGTAMVDSSYLVVSLYYPTIVGRTIVIHQNEDDLGKENNTASRTTGNSGPRVDCCVIALASAAH